MAESNAINASVTGVVGNTGVGFTGTPLTQYLVNCGGATSSTISQVASTGTSGQVLTSGGAAALPSFSNPFEILILSQNASNSSEIVFTDISNGLYNIVISSCKPSTSANLTMQVSNDNGSTWVSTGYLGTEYYNAYNNATLNITTSTSYINLSTSQSSTTGHSGIFNIYFGRTGSAFNSLMGTMTYRTGSSSYNTGKVSALLGSGYSAIRFLYSTGNISSGTFALYRMPLS